MLRVLIPGLAFLLLCSLLACSSNEAREPLDPKAPKQAWYESGVFKELLGGVGEAPFIEVKDPIRLAELAQQGKDLVTVSACGRCHGGVKDGALPSYAGGARMEDRFGEVYASNLSPDSSGLGDWQLGEIVRAVRSSIGKNGRALSLDVHRGYRYMSDKDALAVAVFLKSIPPVLNLVKKRELGTFQKRKYGIISQHSEHRGYVPEVKGERRGAYLANHILGCQSCHSPRSYREKEQAYTGKKAGNLNSLVSTIFSSSKEEDLDSDDTWVGILSEDSRESLNIKIPEPTQVQVQNEPREVFDEGIKLAAQIAAPNIRGGSQAGLASWSVGDIETYLSTGKRPGSGKTYSGKNHCNWPNFAYLNAKDKGYVASYIKSLE